MAVAVVDGGRNFLIVASRQCELLVSVFSHTMREVDKIFAGNVASYPLKKAFRGDKIRVAGRI